MAEMSREAFLLVLAEEMYSTRDADEIFHSDEDDDGNGDGLTRDDIIDAVRLARRKRVG